MNRPKMLVCYICGREYGSASLDIHQKQCKKRWVTMEEQKPKHLRKPLPEPPEITSEIIEKVSQSRNVENFTQADVIALQNEAALTSFNTNTLVPCAFCGRTFLEEKLKIHNKSCREGNTSKKVGDTAGPRLENSRVSTPKKKVLRQPKQQQAVSLTPQPLVEKQTTYSGSYSYSNRQNSSQRTVEPSPRVDTAQLQVRLEKLENMALDILTEIKEIKQIII